MTKRLTLGWSLGLLAQLSAIGLLLTSAWLISRAAEHPPVLYLMVAIVAVRAFGVARSVLRYGERLMTHDAAFRLLGARRLEVYEALDAAAPVGLPTSRRGDVVHRVVQDVDAVQDGILRVRIPHSVALFSSFAVAGMVLWIDRPTGIILMAAIFVLVAVIPAVTRYADVEDTTVALRGDLAVEISVALTAAPDLIAFGATDVVRERVELLDRRLAAAQRRHVWLNGLSAALVVIVLGAVVAVAARLGMAAVADGSLPRVLLAVLVLAPLALVEPLSQLGPIAQTAQRVRSSLERVRELESVTSAVVEPVAPATLPARWDLELRDLVFGWDGHPVALPVMLSLEQGGVLGITGSSGSGKTTLAWTLLRLINAQSGMTLLGGVDTGLIHGDDVRRRIGLLEQDAHVFNTSVRENLLIGKPDAGDPDLMIALEQAGLSAFVASLPDGLDTMVGENGSSLSGGERQRLAIARMLLGNRSILIFDEPTEHLDHLAAEALLDDILSLSPAHSMIVISHAPDVLARLERVIQLDRPSLIASGAH